MYIEGFGKVKLEAYEIENTDKLLMIEFKHKNKLYNFVCDKSGKQLTNISCGKIVEIFADEKANNFCITRKNDDLTYESYHIAKKAFDFETVTHITSSDKVNRYLVKTINDDYWFLINDDNNRETINLYDKNNNKIITKYFHEITFEEENSKALALVERHLYCINEENEEIYVGSLMAYINKKGYFISPMYCPENDTYYKTDHYNRSFTYFNSSTKAVTLDLYKDYLEKQKEITEKLEILYENIKDDSSIIPKNKEGKILNFKSRD